MPARKRSRRAEGQHAEQSARVLSCRLSGADAAFLYLERKEIPLHIAGVLIFDGAIPFEEFVARIDSRLHLIPRYRQIAVLPPYNVGYPTWEFDPGFDIRRHMFQTHLDPPGGEAELQALAGRILSPLMDRGKPLWDIHVVDGLKDGRGALIVRVHHSLADGVAGAALLQVLLDPSPEGSPSVPPPRVRAPRPPAAGHSLTDAISGAVRGSLENLIMAEAGILDLAHGLFTERMQKGLQGLMGLLPELAVPIQRLPFNKPCSGDRLFCWTEVSLADVQAVREAAGSKLNDVILTVLTLALARYVKLHGESIHQRFVRVVCPVNVRRDDQRDSLGNRITFLPVVLPLDVKDPMERLRGVATRMEIMKSVRAAELVGIAACWLGAAPPPLQAAFWGGIPSLKLPMPLFNIICTNVPGSPTPLYTTGRRLLASYPQVPTGYELGVGCAAQSYDGKLFFGLIADAHVAPDVARLRDFLGDSFQELCRAAGVKKAPRRTRAPRSSRQA